MAKPDIQEALNNIDSRIKTVKLSYLCKCDWGKECVVSTSCLVNGYVISCGCRNKDNKANISSVDKGFTDGTNIQAI